MTPVVRITSILVVVATGLAVSSCRPPPVQDSDKENFDPNFDSEFKDSSEFSAAANEPRPSDTAENQPYQPCGGKKCGQECTECSPHDDGCVELLVMKQCTLAGQCVVGPVDCTPPKNAGKGKGKGKKK